MKVVVMLLALAALPAFAQDGGVDAASGTFLDVAESHSVDRASAFVTRLTAPWRERLPPSWKQVGPFGLQHWQWLALSSSIALAVVLAALLTLVTRRLVRRLVRDQNLARQLENTLKWPARVAWFSLLMMIFLPAVSLSIPTETTFDRIIKLSLATAIFWSVLRTVSAWSRHFAETPFVQSRPGARALVNLISGIARFTIAGLAVIVLLAELGYSATSVLAGLGIGGIALALGAQKTLENLFGAFALAVDQPIREGEYVKIDNFTGHVESIGLRSTRIRTLDRTIVSLPNGKLADMRLETYAARDRIRLVTTVGVVYGTTSAQLEALTAALKAMLAEQPTLWSEGHSVFLTNLGESALEIELIALFETSDYGEFRAIREQVLFGVMKAVEAVGTELAFRTVTVIQQPATTTP